MPSLSFTLTSYNAAMVIQVAIIEAGQVKFSTQHRFMRFKWLSDVSLGSECFENLHRGRQICTFISFSVFRARLRGTEFGSV